MTTNQDHGHQEKLAIEATFESGYDIFRAFVAELPDDESMNLITTLDEYSI